MTRTILYYPHINIRNQNWLKQAVLYWDNVGTIVPREVEDVYWENPTFKMLREHDLLRMINPEEHVEEGDQLTEEFISIRNSPNYARLNRQYKSSRQRYAIYRDKIPGSLQKYLEKNSLVEIPSAKDWFMLFGRLDGLLYMSLLAKYLADQDNNAATTPGTDYDLYQNLMLDVGRGGNKLSALAFTLKNALPIPGENTSLEKILSFRQEHRVELLRFRELMDQFQSAVSKAKTNGEIQQISNVFSEKIELNVNALEGELEDSQITVNRGTFKGVLLSGAEFLEGVVEGVKNPFTPGRKVLERVFEIEEQHIHAQNGMRRILRENAYSYLYSAEQARIIDPL